MVNEAGRSQRRSIQRVGCTRGATPSLVTALAFSLVPSLALMAGCKGPADASASPAPTERRASITITTAPAQRAEWSQSYRATGNISAWQEASVGAEVAGLRVADVLVNVGDEVRKGQTLATLSSSTVANDLAGQQAALAEARASLAMADADVARAARLQDSGAISSQQVAQYRMVRSTAQARAQAIEARIRTEQTRMGQTRVVAPDDGIISQRAATVGSVALPGQEMFRLIRQGRLEWRAEVPGVELYRVKAGDAASIELPGGREVRGRVRAIAPTMDAQTRNGIVYVDLLDSDVSAAGAPARDGASPRAGMFARGTLLYGRSDALTVPASAIQQHEGFSYLFIHDPAQRMVNRARVELGRRQGDRVEVISGVAAGQMVATSGVGFLTDGDVVNVSDPVARSSQK